jgi:methionine-rich copper-binding protein CopC
MRSVSRLRRSLSWPRRPGHRHRGGAALAAGLAATALVAASVLGLAGPASAHNYLVSSTPSAGEALTVLPEKFVITTNEGLLDLSGHGAGFAFQLRDSAGKYYDDGCVTVTGSSMSITPALGAPGKYTVIWQIVSADGHPVSNEFDFSWAPAQATTPAVGTDTPANCDGQSGGGAPGAAPSDASGGTTAPANAVLGDVLWIGGGILAVGIAVTITLLLVGRRKKA